MQVGKPGKLRNAPSRGGVVVTSRVGFFRLVTVNLTFGADWLAAGPCGGPCGAMSSVPGPPAQPSSCQDNQTGLQVLPLIVNPPPEGRRGVTESVPEARGGSVWLPAPVVVIRAGECALKP